MIQMYVDHPDLHEIRPLLAAANHYGASPISEAVMDRAIAKLPMSKFAQAYGMTELSPLRDPPTLEGSYRRRPRQGSPSLGGTANGHGGRPRGRSPG